MFFHLTSTTQKTSPQAILHLLWVLLETTVFIYVGAYIWSCWEHLLLVDISLPDFLEIIRRARRARTPTQALPQPGKSMGFVGLTSQFMLMQIVILVSV